MKLQNRDIFLARQPLQGLANMKLPIKSAFAVAKLANVLNDPLRIIDEMRNKLIEEYGEKNEDGQMQVKTDSEQFGKFMAEVNELMDQEVDITFEKVKLPEKIAATCDACQHNMDKTIEIEPAILMALEKFIIVA